MYVGNPNNTIKKVSKLIARYLKSIQHSDRLCVHGDASTKTANSISDRKRFWMDLLIDTLQKKGFETKGKVGNKNPSIAMTGEFISTIFDCTVPDIEIYIDESYSVSIEGYMSVQKDANGAILRTKVKNRTISQTYEEHGHLSDTFRYVVVDLCSEQYMKFSDRRERNLYVCNGTINFFNPDTECKYTKRILYMMPSVNGKLVLIQAFKCGSKWHIVNVVFMDTTSAEDIRSSILSHESDSCVIGCTDIYFPSIQELRSSTSKEIRVMKEFPDVDERIAATSDYVKNSILFSASKIESNTEYVTFVNNLIDYNKDSETKEASAVLSGLVQLIVKLGLN